MNYIDNLVSDKNKNKIFSVLMIVILLSSAFATYKIGLQKSTYYGEQNYSVEFGLEILTKKTDEIVYVYDYLEQGLNNSDLDLEDLLEIYNIDVGIKNRYPMIYTKMYYFRFIFSFYIAILIIRIIALFIQNTYGKKTRILRLINT